jgi:hypothetical protein
MGGILPQSSVHLLGERHHVGVVPLAEAQAAEVLALRVPGIALQGRERFESASAAAVLTWPLVTSLASLARFFLLVVAAALSLMRLCILSFVSWDFFFCKCRSAGFSRLLVAAPPERERKRKREKERLDHG